MKITNLRKSYQGKPVIQDIHLEIPKGQVTSFIGPNGAGKSTLLGLLSRLVAKEEGLIELEGKALDQWKSKDLAKKLAILTQQAQVHMKLTVRELVAFGRFPHSGSRLQVHDQVLIDQALAYMELEDLADSYLDQLSGGQRQRAFIAMVIAQDTDYILLDEPTNNLDIYHARNLMRLIRRLSQDMGKTVLLVLHEINYAAFYSDYICAMAEGKVQKFGKVEEVIQKDLLSQLYQVDFQIYTLEGKPLTLFY